MIKEQNKIYDCGCGGSCLLARCAIRDRGGCICCCNETTSKRLWDSATEKEREEGFMFRMPISEDIKTMAYEIELPWKFDAIDERQKQEEQECT